jgi:iron complex outermembrane receptor protein
LAGRGKIGKTEISTLAGYTYILPVALEPGLKYPVRYGLDSLTYASSSSDSTGYLLKYRFQHLVKGDIEFTRGPWMLGFSVRYNSYMRNIDKIFEDLDDILGLLGQPLPGLKEYREDNKNKGNLIFDARLGYQVNEKIRLSFVVNNLTNQEYTLRPMSMEAPRTTAVQLQIKF